LRGRCGVNDERWYSLLDDLEERLEFENRGDGPGPRGARVEWVTFRGPRGLMKLERTSRPVVLDRKIHYSKRIGGKVGEELVVSDTEKTYRVALYEWGEPEGWVEVDFRQLTG
jgi:hypothetical protein